jgi:hypothetical protein
MRYFGWGEDVYVQVFDADADTRDACQIFRQNIGQFVGQLTGHLHPGIIHISQGLPD